MLRPLDRLDLQVVVTYIRGQAGRSRQTHCPASSPLHVEDREAYEARTWKHPKIASSLSRHPVHHGREFECHGVASDGCLCDRRRLRSRAHSKCHYPLSPRGALASAPTSRASQARLFSARQYTRPHSPSGVPFPQHAIMTRHLLVPPLTTTATSPSAASTPHCGPQTDHSRRRPRRRRPRRCSRSTTRPRRPVS
jgi:hypothetical protein